MEGFIPGLIFIQIAVFPISATVAASAYNEGYIKKIFIWPLAVSGLLFLLVAAIVNLCE